MSMKTINYILGCCIAMTLLYACIDDEGNYDYSELKTVNITNVYSNWSVPLGEEYVITPTIDYGDTDPSEFVYTWVSEIQEEWSDTLSRDKELRYTFKEIARYMTTFVVEHVPTGALTSKQIDLNTVSRYSTGWTILSEQNNKSVLSYIRAERSGENSIIYNFFKDIYTTLRGDDLGTGPIRMGRHFSSSSDEILVIQESGAVEIDGQDFSQAIATHEEFVGGAYPANFVPKQAEYGARLEAILGTDGNVYTRVNPNGSFQICQYNTHPAFSNARIEKMYYCAYLGYIYMYDELNHRMIALYDEPQAYTGMVIYPSMHPDSTHVDNFTPVDDMGEGTQLVFIGSYNVEGATGRDFVQIIKKGTNYYFQTYKADNVLYCWNRINQVEVFYTFSSKITDIERYANGSDREEIAVGLENGEFYIIDASYESISGQKEKVLFKTEGLGRVVDVQYKYGNSSNFNKESRL